MPSEKGRFYAEPFPMFQRAMRNILSITNDFPALVTTTYGGVTPVADAHQYSSGLIVRLFIPYGFGMQQANQFLGEITVVSDTQFTLPLDATQMDPFVIPAENPGKLYTAAQVVPVGENNALLTEATQNVLPYP